LLDRLFHTDSLKKEGIDYKEYSRIIEKVTSEMFYSIVSILYDRLPCSQNFFRLKNKYRKFMQKKKRADYSPSPSRTIASLNTINRQLPGTPKNSAKSGFAAKG